MNWNITSGDVVLSGIRATGKLHLGNFLGAIRNFVDLQERYVCFFFIADYHSLTTETNPDRLRENLPEVVIDYLAAGLNPQKCTIFAQSSVPEIAELALLLSMVQPLRELERLPTYRDKMNVQSENVNAGLLYYPILMAADILIQKAVLIPVGKDQLPHIYFTQKIARRFNARYGETFPIPEALQGKTIKVPGLDGTEKMGKTEGNTINLDDPPEVVRKKVAVAVTDTARKRREDSGNPYECNMFALHELLSPPGIIEQVSGGCKTAGIGCVGCKEILSQEIIELLAPIQEKRTEIAANPDFVRQVLYEGARRARMSAQDTITEVREKMGLRQF